MRVHIRLCAAFLALACVMPLAVGSAGAAQSHAAIVASLTASDPAAIVKAIYQEATKGKSDGGYFILGDKNLRRRLLSKSLLAALTQAEAKVEPGDEGPIDFDPVTNAQDSVVKSFTVASEKQDGDSAVIAVTLIDRKDVAPRKFAADRIVRYDFVREDNRWKINDLRGAIDGEPWSLLKILQDSMTD
jgi:hypothetical protein